MHRGALATANRARRRNCRPRGRRRCNSSSRPRLAELVGWLDAQRYSGAGARFAETATALGRWQKLDGAAAVMTGKTEKKEERRRRRFSSYNATQKLKEATQETSPRQRKAEDVHVRAWNAEEGRRRCSLGGGHCSQ